jgi:O-acetyl-ADP-ribose deacetylase (regulator of RNase III)
MFITELKWFNITEFYRKQQLYFVNLLLMFVLQIKGGDFVMALFFLEQDITKIKADAIVNAANTDLVNGGGVCGAIFKAAGTADLDEACSKLAPCSTGKAVITSGFKLSKYIIHTPGPIWVDGKHHEKELLTNCYTNALQLAVAHECQSIAFPLISTGIYNYPKDEALRVAVDTIRGFLKDHDLTVYLTIFGRFSLVRNIRTKGALDKYIVENMAYVRGVQNPRLMKSLAEKYKRSPLAGSVKKSMPSHGGMASKRKDSFDRLHPSASIPFDSKVCGDSAAFSYKASFPRPVAVKEDIIKDQVEEPFAEAVLEIIRKKDLDEVDVYKRANLDRKLFSKLRSNKNYQPSRSTAISLAVGLQLTLTETEELLEKAGYALSKASMADWIVKYYLLHRCYDIITINEALLDHGAKPFGPA